MTGLLSAPSLPAPAVKKPFRYCWRRVWTAFLGLCISKKPQNVPRPPCQSHLHSSTWLSSEPFIVQPTSKIHQNDKCCCGRYYPHHGGDDKTFVTGLKLLTDDPSTSLHVSLCQCVQFSQGEPRLRGRGRWFSPLPPKQKTGSEKMLIFSESGQEAAVVCCVEFLYPLSWALEAAVLVYVLHISRANGIRTIQKEPVLCVDSHLRRPLCLISILRTKKWVEN